MKKFNLENIIPPDKTSHLTRYRRYHRISLGNGKTCYFKQQQHAYEYVNELEIKINTVLLELNNIYTSLFIEYRKNAIIYNEYFIKAESKINGLINVIEHRFFRMFRKISIVDNNYLFFNSLEIVISQLLSFGTLIKEALKYPQTVYIDSIVYRLNEILEESRNFGEDLQKDTPHVYFDNSKSNAKLDEL